MKTYRIIGIIFVYNPKIEELIYNIHQYIENIELLILWQNSILSIKDQILLKSIDENRILILGDGTNIGLAKPVNLILAKYGNMYQFLLTMDQDSTWVNFEDYVDSIIDNLEIFKENNIRIFGPQLITDMSQQITEIEDKIVDHVITSGAIYTIDIFKTIGGLREDYFIDALDEEICWRALKYGIKTIRISKAVLFQKFGDTTTKRFLFIKANYMKHTVLRNYYIVRNHIYLLKEYKAPIKTKILICYNYILSALVKILLFDRKRFAKTKAIFTGIYHGIKMKKKKLSINYPLGNENTFDEKK